MIQESEDEQYVSQAEIERLRRRWLGILREDHTVKPSIKDLFFARGERQFVRRQFETTIFLTEGVEMPVAVSALEPIQTSPVRLHIGSSSFVLGGMNGRNQDLDNETYKELYDFSLEVYYKSVGW